MPVALKILWPIWTRCRVLTWIFQTIKELVTPCQSISSFCHYSPMTCLQRLVLIVVITLDCSKVVMGSSSLTETQIICRWMCYQPRWLQKICISLKWWIVMVQSRVMYSPIDSRVLMLHRLWTYLPCKMLIRWSMWAASTLKMTTKWMWLENRKIRVLLCRYN